MLTPTLVREFRGVIGLIAHLTVFQAISYAVLVGFGAVSETWRGRGEGSPPVF
jgi:hypothetical protein